MPEVIFNGPEGRLEGRYQMSKKRGAPIALLLHPHPQFGGTMNNQIIYNLYYQFLDRGFSVLRFNFRGVGRSQACSTMALASCRTPPPRSTGRRRWLPRPRPAGWPASPSAHGSACSS